MTPAAPRYTSIPFPSTRNRRIKPDDPATLLGAGVDVVPPQDIQTSLNLLPRATSLSTANWKTAPHYLYGIDLFNHGYWWEAHATWEELWHASGHQTDTGRFLQALIQCAGALFKHSQGATKGALGLGEKAVKRLAAFPDPYMGMDIASFSAHLTGFLCKDRKVPPIILLTID